MVTGRRIRTALVGMIAVALLTPSLAPVAAYADVADVVSVRDFGAAGDGIADDTAAFQNALDAAAGKTLSVPAGTYLVGPVRITRPVNVVGAGTDATLIEAKNDLRTELFVVKDTSGVNFSDLEMDGNRATYTTGHASAIRYLRASDGLVERVDIHDFERTAVDVYEGSTRIVVKDSTFAYNENDVLFHKSTYNQAIGNVGSYTRTESFASYEEAYGPQVSGHNRFVGNKSYHAETGYSFQRSHYNYAAENYAEDCQWGLVIVGLRDPVNQNTYANVAENNTFVGGPKSLGTGILTDDRTYDATITGNVVRDWPDGPMGPVRLQGKHTVFTNNRIENAGQQCEISADDVVFSGNTISRTAGVGLLVTRDVARARIENNIIERCANLGFQTLAALKDSTFAGNTLKSNRTAGSGHAIWANSGSVWTNTVFANNRIYDDQTTKTQTNGVYLRAGSTVAVAGNTISGSSSWPTASTGAVVAPAGAASSVARRWTCTSAGTPGSWAADEPAVVTPPSTETSPSAPSTETTPAPASNRKVKRVAGRDRYATAVAISAESFTAADSVVLATGAQYPDALAASALAGMLDAPLLLTPTTVLRDDVAAEISRLGATKVVIVGGKASVGSSVETGLKLRGLEVERIAGANRYATSAAVARRVAGSGTVETVFVARGDDFADALSASPLAYGKRAPVLLTRTTYLPAETLAALREMAPARIVVVGGASAVDANVKRALEGISPDVQRVSGSTRYGTSAAIARFAIANGWATADQVGIAAGDRFPDALGGGAACGNAGGLLLLTPPPALPSETRSVLTELMTDSTSIQLYGGAATVFSDVETDVRALAL